MLVPHPSGRKVQDQSDSPVEFQDPIESPDSIILKLPPPRSQSDESTSGPTDSNTVQEVDIDDPTDVEPADPFGEPEQTQEADNDPFADPPADVEEDPFADQPSDSTDDPFADQPSDTPNDPFSEPANTESTDPFADSPQSTQDQPAQQDPFADPVVADDAGQDPFSEAPGEVQDPFAESTSDGTAGSTSATDVDATGSVDPFADPAGDNTQDPFADPIADDPSGTESNDGALQDPFADSSSQESTDPFSDPVDSDAQPDQELQQDPFADQTAAPVVEDPFADPSTDSQSLSDPAVEDSSPDRDELNDPAPTPPGVDEGQNGVESGQPASETGNTDLQTEAAEPTGTVVPQRPPTPSAEPSFFDNFNLLYAIIPAVLVPILGFVLWRVLSGRKSTTKGSNQNETPESVPALSASTGQELDQPVKSEVAEASRDSFALIDDDSDDDDDLEDSSVVEFDLEDDSIDLEEAEPFQASAPNGEVDDDAFTLGADEDDDADESDFDLAALDDSAEDVIDAVAADAAGEDDEIFALTADESVEEVDDGMDQIAFDPVEEANAMKEAELEQARINAENGVSRPQAGDADIKKEIEQALDDAIPSFESEGLHGQGAPAVPVDDQQALVVALSENQQPVEQVNSEDEIPAVFAVSNADTDLSSELLELKKEMELLQSEKSQLTGDLSDAKMRLDEANDRIAAATREASAEVDAAVARAEAAESGLREAKEAAEAKINEFQSLLDEKQSELEQKSMAFKDADDNRTVLEDELKALKETVKEQASSLNDSNQKAGEAERLKSLLDTAKSESEEAVAKLAETTAELSATHDRLNSTESELEAVRTELESLRSNAEQESDVSAGGLAGLGSLADLAAADPGTVTSAPRSKSEAADHENDPAYLYKRAVYERKRRKKAENKISSLEAMLEQAEEQLSAMMIDIKALKQRAVDAETTSREEMHARDHEYDEQQTRLQDDLAVEKATSEKLSAELAAVKDELNQMKADFERRLAESAESATSKKN